MVTPTWLEREGLGARPPSRERAGEVLDTPAHEAQKISAMAPIPVSFACLRV